MDVVTAPHSRAPTSDDQLAERLARLQQRRQPSNSPAAASGDDSSRPSPARRTRRHPAAGARATALLLTLASTGGLGALFARLNTAHAASAAIDALPAPMPTGGAAAPTTRTTPPDATSAPTSASTTRSAPTTSAPATTATATATQAFNGSLVDTRYGPVQVQAQISDGTISDVAVIAYPDGDGKSSSINARALPELRSEVLTAQQANVDTVSGATYTSTAYQRSLQAAIDDARAAGATDIA